MSLDAIVFHSTCFLLANVAIHLVAHIISAQIIVLMLVAATPSCDQRLFKKFFVQNVFLKKVSFAENERMSLHPHERMSLHPS